MSRKKREEKRVVKLFMFVCEIVDWKKGRDGNGKHGENQLGYEVLN